MMIDNNDDTVNHEYDVNKLNYIREQIENMTKFHHIEILRILATWPKSVTINENNYGIHINLSELDTDLLSALNKYIDYVNAQESYLNDAEKEKENYKKTYF